YFTRTCVTEVGFSSATMVRAIQKTLFEWLLPSRNLKRRPGPLLAGLAYIAAIGLLGGLKSDHLLLGLLPLLDSYNQRTRSFFFYFLPFILTGVVYDSMRYFYWQGIA